MKFLVAGGAGFIGFAVVRYLINTTGHEVVDVDKLTCPGNLESLNEIESSDRYAFEQVDICSNSMMVDVFEKISARHYYALGCRITRRSLY
jgi:dTDP-glucose 4,6-dehydratase